MPEDATEDSEEEKIPIVLSCCERYELHFHLSRYCVPTGTIMVHPLWEKEVGGRKGGRR